MIRPPSKVDVATSICFGCLNVVVIVLGSTCYSNVVFDGRGLV
jgi:hypothetical protein